MMLARRDLDRIVDLAVQHKLVQASTRDLLLNGICPHLAASIQTGKSPREQIEFDIKTLAEATSAEPDAPPLAVWLTNAARQLGDQPVALDMRAFASRLQPVDGGSRVATELGYLQSTVAVVLEQAAQVFIDLDQPQQAEEIHQNTSAVRCGPTIALVGRYSSGKSTFVNALAGRQRLPARVRPTTAVMVFLHSSEAGRVVVSPRTPEQRAQDADRIDLLIKRHERGKTRSDEVELRRLRAYQASEPPPGLAEIIRDAENGDQTALSRCLAQEQNGVAEHIAEVHLDERFPEARVPRGAVIIDTPGVNSPIVDHRLFAWRALQTCDCVLLLLQPDAAIDDAEVDLFESHRQLRADEPDAVDRLVCVVSCIDAEADPDERRHVVDGQAEQLRDYGIETPVLPCSPLTALSGDRAQAGERLRGKERGLLEDMANGEASRAWSASGMPTVLDTVWRIAGRRQVQRVYQPAVSRTQAALEVVSAGLRRDLATLEDGIGEVQREIEALDGVAARLQVQRAGFLSRCRHLIAARLEPFTEVDTLEAVLETTVDECDEPAALEKSVNAAFRRWGERRNAAIDHAIAELATELTGEAARRFAPETDSKDSLLPRLDIHWALTAHIIIKTATPDSGPPSAPLSMLIVGAGLGSLVSAPFALLGGFIGWALGERIKARISERKAKWLARARAKLGQIIPKALDMARSSLHAERNRLIQDLGEEVRVRVDAWLDTLRARSERQREALAELRADREKPLARTRDAIERVAAVQDRLREAEDAVASWLRITRGDGPTGPSS